MWDLVPCPGIEPQPPELAARSLSHWITREVPCLLSWMLHDWSHKGVFICDARWSIYAAACSCRLSACIASTQLSLAGEHPSVAAHSLSCWWAFGRSPVFGYYSRAAVSITVAASWYPCACISAEGLLNQQQGAPCCWITFTFSVSCWFEDMYFSPGTWYPDVWMLEWRCYRT